MDVIVAKKHCSQDVFRDNIINLSITLLESELKI